MNPVGDVRLAGNLLLRLEAIELQRARRPRETVRSFIASKLRAMPETLENIRRGRVKSVQAWLMDRIKAELLAALSAEIGKFEHEIQILRQTGTRLDEATLAKAEAQLASVKLILLGER